MIKKRLTPAKLLMVKKVFVIALLLIAFRASAQTSIPGQYAVRYVGQVVSTYGHVYKISRDPETKTMFITFGSKYLLKGVVLRLKNEQKLDMGMSLQELSGRFINVTGRVTSSKGKIFIDGDDPSTIISVRQTLAFN